MIKKSFLMIIFSLVILLSLTSCNSCQEEKEDQIMNNYPGLKDESHIVNEISMKDLIEKISQKETFVVMLGFDACPWCQSLMPEYNESGKENDVDKLYYVDIKDARDEKESNDHIYYLALKNYFSQIVDIEKDRINAPTVVGIKDGKLVDFFVDTVPSHTIDETGTLPALTSSQKNELHQLLKNLFDKVFK